MPGKHAERTRRSVPRRRKQPRLDAALYTAEGYLNWLAKVRKTRKRKH